MRARRVIMVAAAGVVVAGGLAVAGMSNAAQAPRNGCAQVTLIGVRASTERPGVGAMTQIVSQQVTKQSNQTVKTIAVDYPATLGNYNNSVKAGVTALAKDIEATAASCPDSKIVLSGHSQGAQVIGDTLLGAGGRRGGAPAVDSATAGKVVAATLFGDPTFTPGEAIDADNQAKRGGVFTRGKGKTAALDGVAQSFCHSGDTFCDKGNNIAAHLNYRNEANGDATAFILDQIGG